MKVVLIGSETFPVNIATATQVAELMKQDLEPDATVLSRGAKGFDAFVAECARVMGYEIQVFPGRGGAFNFERDAKLAEDGDELWAFFDPERIGQGGTQHVVEKFLDKNKPVRTYTFTGKTLVLVGSHDHAAE